MDEEKELCPKCGKPFLKQGFLGLDDKFKGMVIHSQKTVSDSFGGTFLATDDRCFLTKKEWDKLKNHPELEPQDENVADYC